MVDKRSMTPFLTGAVAVALIIGVSVWVTRSQTSADPRQASANYAQAVQVAEPVQIQASNRKPLAPTAPATPTDFLATMAANNAAVSKLAEAGKEKLRSRYASERVDSAWASSKQQALEHLSVSPQIEQLNAQPLSIQARCRTTVCLVDADFATRLAAEDWHTLYTLNAGTEMFLSSSSTSTNPDGSLHLQIYGLARK